MRFVKILFATLLAVSLSACASPVKQQNEGKEEVKQEEHSPISIVTPMGATALSLLGLYGDENVEIASVDGPDALAAQFHKKEGYDVVIAPINLGAKLISSGKSEFMLHSIVTWGNLYLVGSDEEALNQEGLFAAFGEKAVPQKVLMSALDVNAITLTLQYFGSVQDVQAQLLTQKASVAMMAEPIATATIAKAKDAGISLKIIMDLQKAYQEKNNTEKYGYPQAALFVRKSSLNKVESYIKKAVDFLNTNANNEENMVKAIETATCEKLGVPNSQIVMKTWERQNIHFEKAFDVKKDVDAFLASFNITLDSKYFVK